MLAFLRTTLLLALSVALPMILAGTAYGQTPTTTIQNGAGDTRLQLNDDGGLYVPGTFVTDGTENDFIPASGAGTRMMWYPAKAAFRVGRVGFASTNRDVWDANSIGAYSAAFGVDTEASGDAATAMGFGTTASGVYAVAVGSQTTASGPVATAIGSRTTARGIRTTAMGRETIAASDNSLSIGTFNSANTLADGTLLVVGNGSGPSSSRSDALVLDDQGNLTVSNQNTFSDRRLKTDIEPLGGGILQKLGALRPVRYRFKDPATHPSGEQIGLIAQEVRKAFPSLVSEGAGGILSLSYSKTTAVLVKGLQEQKAVVDSLRGRVQLLERQKEDLHRVKTRLARLESEDTSVLAGLSGPGVGLLVGGLLGGVLAAGLLWRRRT